MVQTRSLASRPLRSIAAERVGSSAIRDLLRLTEREDVISLAGGLPAPDTFPTGAIASAAARVLAEDPSAALQYSVTEGFAPLREWIAARRGAATAPAGLDSVIVTHGSQQALDLLLRAFVEPGDAVAVADPCYVGALQLLRLARAEVVAIDSDADGLRTDHLAAALRDGLRPRLVYVVANFHNPTGATLANDRRHELAALADRYGFVIVDDDPYGELRWSGPALDPLAALSDRVVTLGSFSKTLSPGLRMGYAAAAAGVIADLTILKQAADLHTSSLSQRIVFEVVRRPGFLATHIEAIRSTYAERAAALRDALRRHVGDQLTFAEPQGGMFLWAHGDETIDANALLPCALDAGMAFVPGPAFAARSDSTNPTVAHRSSLRLSFATAPPSDLDEAARRLASVLPG
jgi:2-aminoadipate transaminase